MRLRISDGLGIVPCEDDANLLVPQESSIHALDGAMRVVGPFKLDECIVLPPPRRELVAEANVHHPAAGTEDDPELVMRASVRSVRDMDGGSCQGGCRHARCASSAVPRRGHPGRLWWSVAAAQPLLLALAFLPLQMQLRTSVFRGGLAEFRLGSARAIVVFEVDENHVRWVAIGVDVHLCDLLGDTGGPEIARMLLNLPGLDPRWVASEAESVAVFCDADAEFPTLEVGAIQCLRGKRRRIRVCKANEAEALRNFPVIPNKANFLDRAEASTQRL
mmetsp:Transcript_12399/g.45863  ORF Transcript_12399/g.45863 Transcript_12399/m.45863 type:complete len:276 (+) Transcript_12399:1207-2034(+)